MARSCGTCTKCCEGYLEGTIRGQEVGQGRPCFLLEIGKGCTDYGHRPLDPCIIYECEWLRLDEVPEEFKPDVSGVIICYQEKDNIPYLHLQNAPNDPSVELLSWAVVHARNVGANLMWTVGENSWWVGSDEFVKAMGAS